MLYGAELKVEPMPLPKSLLRKKFVKSANPPGVNLALPILKESGEGAASAPEFCGSVAGGRATLAADFDEGFFDVDDDAGRLADAAVEAPAAEADVLETELLESDVSDAALALAR